MVKFWETQWSNYMKITQKRAGWKDGQAWFHRTLLLTARGPTSTTAVDWHLKVRDIEDDVASSMFCSDLAQLSAYNLFSHQKINFKKYKCDF